MDYFEIVRILNNKLDKLLLEENTLKNLKNSLDLSDLERRNVQYKYNLTIKKINKIRELLDLTKYFKALDSGTLDNKQYKKDILCAYSDLIKLLKENKSSLSDTKDMLVQRISMLNSMKDNALKQKDKEEYKKKLKDDKRMLNILSRCIQTFNSEDVVDVIRYLKDIYNNISSMDMDSIKKARISYIDSEIVSKYNELLSDKLSSGLEYNLSDMSFSSLESISMIAKKFLNNVSNLKECFKVPINIDKELPDVINKMIKDKYKDVRAINFNDFATYISILVNSNKKLIDQYSNDFSFGNIIDLEGSVHTDSISRLYCNLLNKYKDAYPLSFVSKKYKNMEEFLGKRNVEDPYFKSKNNLLNRTVSDLEDIRGYAISYLKSDAIKKYKVLGLTEDDLNLIFDSNENIVSIQQRLDDINNKLLRNQELLEEYYSELLRLQEKYNENLDFYRRKFRELQSEFMFITQFDIDNNNASKFSSMDKMLDIVADCYEQKIFNMLFVPNKKILDVCSDKKILDVSDKRKLCIFSNKKIKKRK